MPAQPPLDTIGRGLSQATERFAIELAQPQPCAPVWDDFEWQMARAAAILHGISPLLAGSLQWSGPAGWQSFLDEQRRQTLQRYRRIAAALEEIDAHATALGLSIMMLKGAALHELGIYAPGERPMADIDLLVRPADNARVGQLLIELGYTQTWLVWKHRVFERGPMPAHAQLPPGEHEGYPLKIDLHERIAERLPVTETDITSLVFPAQPHPGLNPYPSATALLLHLLLHATGNLTGRAIRLIHLRDIARLAATLTMADWGRLAQALAGLHGGSWALPPLALVSRFQPELVPQGLMTDLRSGTSWSLRRLSAQATLAQLSYASLEIGAFPGLPWCDSPREVARYLAKRLFPDLEQRFSRTLVAAELWSAQSSWSRMSQLRRMLQWTLRRPPRQASMYIVRKVLESPMRS